MSVSLFTGCVHPHKGFHRGLRLRTKVAYQLSSPASLCRLLYIHTHCGQLRSFFLFCCVSCTVALLRCCAAVSLARLCGRPHISEFCHDFGSTALLFDFDLASCLVVSGHSSARRVFMSVGGLRTLSRLGLVCSKTATLELAVALPLRWNGASTFSGCPQ